ncbi:MAG TPA: phage holin family protein [Solirubrobacteraceae bacterium]|nr:phage holin family protein [Solirubrobacteraceae bacterium]
MAAEQPEEEIPANIAAAITEISERATLLIRDELDLARAEITSKLRKLLLGALVGTVAGAFIALAGLFVLIGLAWLLWYELFPSGQVFWGFFVVAGALLLFAALGGLLAMRALRRGAPPAPTMAIEEARKIREAVTPTEESAPAGEGAS